MTDSLEAITQLRPGLSQSSLEPQSSSDEDLVSVSQSRNSSDSRHESPNDYAVPLRHEHFERQRDESLDRSHRQWTGSGHKYLRLISEERELRATLDQVENDDLSIHLYDTHAIKRHAYERRLLEEKDRSDLDNRSKTKWLRKGAWVPPPSWSAWPLRPHQVPAKGELWGRSEPWDHLKAQDWEQSDIRLADELRELLHAQMTKHSRLAYNEHKGRSAKSSPNGSRRQSATVSISTEPHDNGSGRLLEEPDRSNDNARRSSASLTPEEVGSGMESDDEVDRHCGHASPAVDDDQSMQILDPVISKTIARLDDLLLALERSAKNSQLHSSARRRSASKGNAVSSSASTSEIPMLESKAQANEDATTTDDTSSNSSRGPTRSRRAKNNLSDWSEIVGMAAILGWDSEVLEAVKRRCSNLFGEDMALQTLGGGEQTPVPNPPVIHSSRYLSRATPQDKPLLGYACPEKTCKTTPFTRRKMWLKHIKDAHGYDYTGAETLVQLDRRQKQLEPASLFCPDEDCPRSIWLLPTVARLHEHMKRKHGDSFNQPSQRSNLCCLVKSCPFQNQSFETSLLLDQHVRTHHANTTTSVGSTRGRLGEAMHGDVHVDNFMCQIPNPFHTNIDLESNDDS